MLKFEGYTKKPRFINPPNLLKQKVGSGGIDESRIDNAEKIIETSEFDFIPYAEEYLKDLNKAINQIFSEQYEFDEAIEVIIKPIMNLKANGGMFGYQLISDISDILLEYLDTIREINPDAHTVIRAHEKALQVIINNKLRGNGGAEGLKLTNELESACIRYFNKHTPADE